MSGRPRQRGFTLIELAISLFIVALVLSSLLVPLGTQVEQRQMFEAEKAIDQLKDALLGYALANGHLPCPDAMSGAAANDGLEDVQADGSCSTDDGNLPWVTLGTGTADPWNNRYRYHVDDAYASRSPSATFTLSSGASLRVWTTAARTTALTSSDPNGAVAVILSHGKNGKGAVSALTNTPNAAAASADERENTDGTVNFVSRPPSASDSAAGEFDDIVSWMSRFTLYNRMVGAGRLP
ncbi:MAG: type II secretion system protein [Rhodospirillaceae bacterium]